MKSRDCKEIFQGHTLGCPFQYKVRIKVTENLKILFQRESDDDHTGVPTVIGLWNVTKPVLGQELLLNLWYSRKICQQTSHLCFSVFAVNCCDIFCALFQGSLFFAGEATDQGHYGTVTGAMLVSLNIIIFLSKSLTQTFDVGRSKRRKQGEGETEKYEA